MAEQTPRLSVRTRLLVIALLPTLVIMPLLIGITMQRWLWRTDQILIARVASDLTVAQQYLSHLIDNTDQQITALAGSVALRDAQPGLFENSRTRLGLDYLYLMDQSGNVIGASPSDAAPLAPPAPGNGIEILQPQDLAALSLELAQRAQIDVAAEPPRTETRGMVVQAVSTVSLPDGQTGTLAGGILLNRNDGFVDQINDLVYPPRPPSEGADQGVTTLFLDDIRIATTLRPEGEARALGTRASDAVRRHVLDGGGVWRDTAFVVNDWYFSAYAPIMDRHGTRVGMLYTGIPTAPYMQARMVTWTIIGMAFLLAALLFVPLFLNWARGIFHPLEAMGRTISRVEAGDLSARTQPSGGAPEILRLARHLDQLLDRIQERDRALRDLNAELNDRVIARTADLSRANLALQTATRQLVLSEKLATIGEVTAGVAHEINNPLAVMQGNLEVLRMVFADRMDEVSTEFALIESQIRRISALVSQLLQFARPEEFQSGPASSDPAAVARDILPLVQHLLASAQVELQMDLRATRRVSMNIPELQQIFVNLISNAVKAMPQGGRIDLTCHDDDIDGRAGVRITLRDTGIGMDDETLTQIFQPFFTTRGPEGTGLGLSVCQTLIHRQGGEISARSVPGQGTSFTIWLPEADA